MRIYLAGPMRGHERDNHDLFDRVAAEWEEDGHTVVSPARIARARGKNDSTGYYSTELWMRESAILDVTLICHSDGIALLPGWERSRGATIEVAVAHSICLPIYDAITKEAVEIRICPWELVKS